MSTTTKDASNFLDTQSESAPIEVETVGSSLAMVRVPGDIDLLSVEQFSQTLLDTVERFDEVVVDLSAVTFFSSVGLEAVIGASRCGELRVFAPRSPARWLFEICAPDLLSEH